MIGFVRRYLEPVDRMGEILFGLIMALGFTGAVRLGLDTADNRALFVAVLGCNIAWGIVDGTIFVLARLFERGRVARLRRGVQTAPDDAAAVRVIAAELEERLEPLLTEPRRAQLYRWVLESVRRQPVHPVRATVDDLLGAIAVALIVVLATAPVVVPFLIVRDPWLAVRLSNTVGLALLFLVGHRWARFTGAAPISTGVGISLVGLVLVLVTIALGG